MKVSKKMVNKNVKTTVDDELAELRLEIEKYSQRKELSDKAKEANQLLTDYRFHNGRI